MRRGRGAIGDAVGAHRTAGARRLLRPARAAMRPRSTSGAPPTSIRWPRPRRSSNGCAHRAEALHRPAAAGAAARASWPTTSAHRAWPIRRAPTAGGCWRSRACSSSREAHERMTTAAVHPRDALFDAQAGAVVLPVCDHYCGVEARMRKSLRCRPSSAPVFDVTLDCEDGAPVGGEAEHARAGRRTRDVGCARLPASARACTRSTMPHSGRRRHHRRPRRRAPGHLMVPKVERSPTSCAPPRRSTPPARSRSAAACADRTTLARCREFDIAAHPRIESLSFGLMDFVSAHRGAIPAAGMGAAGQFRTRWWCAPSSRSPPPATATPRRRRTASSPSSASRAMRAAATRAADELGYTRMWSIHPTRSGRSSRRSRRRGRGRHAVEIVCGRAGCAVGADPLRDTLHDRASYRYFWQVLERAHAPAGRCPTRRRRGSSRRTPLHPKETAP